MPSIIVNLALTIRNCRGKTRGILGPDMAKTWFYHAHTGPIGDRGAERALAL